MAVEYVKSLNYNELLICTDFKSFIIVLENLAIDKLEK